VLTTVPAMLCAAVGNTPKNIMETVKSKNCFMRAVVLKPQIFKQFCARMISGGLNNV